MFQITFALSEILPVILYACFIKKNRHEGLLVIFLYCLISLSAEFLYVLLRHTFDRFYLYASFTIVEYTLITIFLYSSIKGKNLKLIPILGSLIFYTLAFINFQIKKSENFDSLAASGEALLIIVYSIVFLYTQIKDPSVLFVYHTKKFWIVIGFFIYFSSTFFLFLYASSLTKQEYKSYFYINYVFDILKNILFCIAFSMRKSTPAKYPMENMYADI